MFGNISNTATVCAKMDNYDNYFIFAIVLHHYECNDMILTFILNVYFFIVKHLLSNCAKTADDPGRFASNRMARRGVDLAKK